MNRVIAGSILVLFSLFFFASSSFAESEEEAEKSFDLPSHVLDISKENTHSNETEDYEQIEPNEQTKELLENANVSIENPDFIQLLNETTIRPSPIGIGYRGMIYLGRWPVAYGSQETEINWEYQSININEKRNTSDVQEQMHYLQQESKEVKGVLTNKIANPEIARRMVLETAKDKTNLPLAYQTTIGKNTKTDSTYYVTAQKTGHLEAYVPAVNEKGEVTFGDVYIELRGLNKNLVIKNVTKQKIGAWLPVQNHVSYSFRLK